VTELLAVCPHLPGNELVAAECENLTGGIPDTEGVAFCQTVGRISQAAYVQTGLRLIAQAEALPELVRQVSERQFPADDFRIEYLRLSDQNPVKWKTAVVALADAIKAFPNLDVPRHRFLLVVGKDHLWFGEILAETSHSYRRHDAKPYRTSSSLPSRLARALLNLAAPPAQSILDPCCGTGSILLEAACLGLQAVGADRNPRMVHLSRRNLAHFGYAVEVRLADARELSMTVDAVVTDLPYGKFSKVKSGEIQAILNQSARLAPLGIFVAGGDLTAELRHAGYQDIALFYVRKRNDFSRLIYRARSGYFSDDRLTPLDLHNEA